eukprot:1158150-Pelagomonas_calceolata.AAC.2
MFKHQAEPECLFKGHFKQALRALTPFLNRQWVGQPCSCGSYSAMSTSTSSRTSPALQIVEQFCCTPHSLFMGSIKFITLRLLSTSKSMCKKVNVTSQGASYL